MQAATTTDSGTHVTHQRGALDRELFCPQLERLLLGAASELGQTGNLAQVVASIERGGVGGGGEDPNLRMLRRLGATDTRGIDGRIRRLSELEQRWRDLPRKHQATALAQYLGTPRAHATLREHFGSGQGGVAGVVLYRWQAKQAKARARDADSSALAEALERVRAELAPVDAELAALRRLSRRAAPIPNLPKPTMGQAQKLVGPDGDAEALHTDRMLEWHQTVLAHRAVARFLAGLRAADIDRQIDALKAQRAPLLSQQAVLCAELANRAAAGNEADDEQALVEQCRGKLTREAKDALVAAATADVRALHRAWYATTKRAAKAWAEDGETAA